MKYKIKYYIRLWLNTLGEWALIATVLPPSILLATLWIPNYIYKRKIRKMHLYMDKHTPIPFHKDIDAGFCMCGVPMEKDNNTHKWNQIKVYKWWEHLTLLGLGTFATPLCIISKFADNCLKKFKKFKGETND